MREVAGCGDGFIYCVARKGVFGQQTEMDINLTLYLSRCRQVTDLPLAIGFGIQECDDVRALIGKADMVVIGSQTIRLVDEKGVGAVGPFIAGLR